MKVYIDANDIGKTVTYKEENGKRQYLYIHDNEGFIFKELSDYDKQVRKEVCEEIQSELLDFTHKYWRVFKQNGKQYMTDDDLIECLNEIISQIQGETK